MQHYQFIIFSLKAVSSAKEGKSIALSYSYSGVWGLLYKLDKTQSSSSNSDWP